MLFGKNPAVAILAMALAWVAVPLSPAASDMPCQDDVRKFCAGVKPGEGRIINCLFQHRAELSEGCKAFVAKAAEGAKGMIDDFMGACGDDLKVHCQGVPPGEGRMVNCLKEHEAHISDACKAAIHR